MMVAALYEMLCQAYSFVNSAEYLNSTGNSTRMRRLRSLTLTYPTGMIFAERERLRKQAKKAIEVFARTLGRKQDIKPDLSLSIDEASAVHLTFIWSELQMLGQRTRFWFELMSRDRADKGSADETDEPEAKEEPEKTRPRPNRLGRRSHTGQKGKKRKGTRVSDKELRIACIDIGGGTTDLMIANYKCESGIEDRVHGEILHQDGISLAGDQLVKRMLECIIVPKFAGKLAMEDEDVQLLFGPEVPQKPRNADTANQLDESAVRPTGSMLPEQRGRRSR